MSRGLAQIRALGFSLSMFRLSFKIFLLTIPGLLSSRVGMAAEACSAVHLLSLSREWSPFFEPTFRAPSPVDRQLIVAEERKKQISVGMGPPGSKKTTELRYRNDGEYPILWQKGPGAFISRKLEVLRWAAESKMLQKLDLGVVQIYRRQGVNLQIEFVQGQVLSQVLANHDLSVIGRERLREDFRLLLEQIATKAREAQYRVVEIRDPAFQHTPENLEQVFANSATVQIGDGPLVGVIFKIVQPKIQTKMTRMRFPVVISPRTVMVDVESGHFFLTEAD